MNAKELFKGAIDDEIEEIRNLGELAEGKEEEEIEELIKDAIRVSIRKWRPYLLLKLKDKDE